MLRNGESGREILPLERADATALQATGWKMPEPFVAKGRDHTTDICGVIWKPTSFSPDKRYPVIENIYAGPHSSFVPKAFASFYGQQRLAERGFIVVMIDGMGTSHRSKAFHDVCWKNLGDAGFPDRIAWLRAAAAARPWMDLTRVGIYGGSAGGQNALRGLLTYPDFYKVGVADCGCHDNRMDKIWWNELWMGWPVGPHYAEQSNVTQAHLLRGKLMLVVGELDKNVDPSSTLQVANALVKADKDFDRDYSRRRPRRRRNPLRQPPPHGLFRAPFVGGTSRSSLAFRYSAISALDIISNDLLHRRTEEVMAPDIQRPWIRNKTGHLVTRLRHVQGGNPRLHETTPRWLIRTNSSPADSTSICSRVPPFRNADRKAESAAGPRTSTRRSKPNATSSSRSPSTCLARSKDGSGASSEKSRSSENLSSPCKRRIARPRVSRSLPARALPGVAIRYARPSASATRVTPTQNPLAGAGR